MEDCHAAGLQTTMVVRSPTYIIPEEYVCHKASLGAYDTGVAVADKRFLLLPSNVDGQLARCLMAMFAEREPDRYTSLAAAGFPVIDSRHPESALMHNLLEQGGGHYVDVGSTKLLVEGNVSIKAGVEPVAYTTKGLQFSDGSCADADAIVWCTGFSDKNACDSAAQILGGSNPDENVNEAKGRLIGLGGIAAQLDATWGLDAEGEIHSMWKRHLHLHDDNFWIMGGYTQQHRWHSRTLALQIKAALEGVLPPAYRDNPLPCPR